MSDTRDSGWILNAPRIVLGLKVPRDKAGKYEIDTQFGIPVTHLKVEKHNRDGSVTGNKVRLILGEDALFRELSREEANGKSYMDYTSEREPGEDLELFQEEL
ncbi:MAG: hypothetical protein ACHQ6U_09975 [Thermodesulfobacteriota bacterium]